MKEDTKKIDELAKKVIKGDKKAFEELYKMTSPKAYFVALQICNDKQEAEDILQESYITALNKISSLERTESFMSWFNRIVANKSKDFLRKKNPGLFSEEDEWVLEGQEDETEEFSPESNVDKEELRTAVMDTVQELNVEKRTCIMMRYFNDMSVNEIAQAMEVPVSTVKNRLFDARKELKALFAKKGITAAYSVAPFGVISWAYEAAFENVAQSFDGSALAAKIFSGIAVAGTAASAAAAGSAATGTGIFAKAVTATTIKKVVSGLIVAGVITGSTVGITSVVKNKKENSLPTTSYTETVDDSSVSEDVNSVINDVQPDAPQEGTAPVVNILDADLNNNGEEKNNNVIVDFKTDGKMPEKVDYKGTLKLGNNHIDFEDGTYTYSVTINVEEPGYYLFTCERKDLYTFAYVYVPEDTQSKFINNYHRSTLRPLDKGNMGYFEVGEHTLLVSRTEGIESTDVYVEYFGEEITDIQIEQEDLDNVILGYNEVTLIGDDGKFMFLAHDYSDVEEGRYANYFRTKIFFSSGKVFDMGDMGLGYYVKDGKLKEGKNTVKFRLFEEEFGYDKEYVITAHPPTDYVKDIEVSNLDELKTVKINEDGFVYGKPENFDVTVTYADGTKETFDGKTWDRMVRLDNGMEIYITFCRARETMTMDYRLRGRESVHFRVSIGETDYIDEICTVTEFDVIGYRKRLDENNLEEAGEYISEIENGIKLVKENADNIEDYLWYSAELLKITGYNSYKIVKRIAGFELDYAITTYKILTENEFDFEKE